ncbi:MAG: hypothetical protein RLZZ283_651 [Candidatus Parcubacteria bacterium]|jgi:hypothetical protein
MGQEKREVLVDPKAHAEQIAKDRRIIWAVLATGLGIMAMGVITPAVLVAGLLLPTIGISIVGVAAALRAISQFHEWDANGAINAGDGYPDKA